MTNREQAEQKAFELQKEYIVKIEEQIISNLTNPNLKGNRLNVTFPLAAGLMAVCEDLINYIYKEKSRDNENDK